MLEVVADAPGKAKPPPHPLIAVSVARDANSSSVSVIQRRRRRGMISRPTMASAGIPNRHCFNAAVDNAVLMVSVDVAGELPGVTEAGVKDAVAPAGSPLAENVTVLENDPLTGVTEMVKLAVPPRVTVCEVLVELTVKLGAAVPVPLRVTVWGEPAALSATLRAAAKIAADDGVNVIDMAQFAPGARVLPQVLVWPKLAAPLPVSEMPEIASAALPVFVSVADCAALVAPVIAVKVSVGGVRVTAGRVAIKLAVTVCGALIVTVVEELPALATLPVQLLKL
jgi:hypothetical protein